MTFEIEKGQKFGLLKQNFVDSAIFEDDARGGPRFVNTALLSEAFFAQLKKHPVPLEEAAVRALSNNSMGLTRLGGRLLGLSSYVSVVIFRVCSFS
jgi:hypothetical protein